VIGGGLFEKGKFLFEKGVFLFEKGIFPTVYLVVL
jgi:hypothetical protein